METQKKVKCINDYSSLNHPLTINKIYTVEKEIPSGKLYLIKCDNNLSCYDNIDKFELVEENTPIKPEHYNYPITPLEYITKNNLGFCEGNIIKYITRYKQKNGKEDLLKAQEYLTHLINEYETQNS